MPEGPQVRRTGQLIESYVGSRVISIEHPKSRKPWDLLLPQSITGVEVVGKNIFIYLENHQIIYNHMLMWGSWRPGCEAIGAKRLNTCFTTTKGRLGYFGGGILRLMNVREAATLRTRIGPDIMTAQNQAEAFARLAASPAPIGEALLSQELVAGVGNIYKSEGLFAAKLHPLRGANAITPKEFERLFAFLQPQMLADVKRPGPITTTTSAMIKAGKRTFVYRRYHQPCVICATKIERIYQGEQLRRSTYFCPRCQAR